MLLPDEISRILGVSEGCHRFITEQQSSHAQQQTKQQIYNGTS